MNHEQPVAKQLWSERCSKNTYVLNDCNWCWCGSDHQYQCKARVCEEVDMFGHFKDTIQEIDVGMEGHGVWRSKPTSCTPGVQYRRGSVHCVCDEDGNWPNPVCRDLFRILHSIEVTENVDEATSQTCLPTKLYLVGCNVCFCPSSGKLDATLCTNRTCTDNDPVLEPKQDENSRKSINKIEEDIEVYAPCIVHVTYTIGCQECKCLPNNRLLCDDCRNKMKKPKKKGKTLCSGNVGKMVVMDCNLCKCDSEAHMYCTTRRCLPKNNKLYMWKKAPQFDAELVEAPIEDQECTPGTSYKKNCNTCYCKVERGVKIFRCTTKRCHTSIFEDMARNCTEGTTYETDCHICHCDDIDGVKYETCKVNNKCISTLVLKEHKSHSLDSLHGYCEPLHEYKKSCNTCRCLANGKMVKCTTHLCVARTSDPVSVDIVPLQQEENEPCPEGYSYKIGCNVCFCLSNGNSLCTTVDCSKIARKRI
ncbi:uncharacterized protein [Epargyreus clarus]|uniref:uncharacterized protein n=1 Tax=Epargyreus clarus TaxID=520877 RepID=UPI003C2C6E75